MRVFVRKFLYFGITFLGLIGSNAVALSQSVTLSLASASATPGGTITIPIGLTSMGGAQAVGFQGTFSYSSDIIGVTVVAGTSANAAGKSLTCNGNNCVIFGFNSTVIADGPVAVVTFQIAANPASNPIPIQLTRVVGTTAGGTSIPSSGLAGSITPPRGLSPLGSLSCTNSSINTPGSTSCSVTSNAAAASGGFVVGLSSNNANLTVPSSVTIAAGQTSSGFTATGALLSANQSATVTANAGGVNLTNTISLVAPAQLSSLACAPSTLGSNASGTCTVTLNKAATSATTVALASNNGSLTVPVSVVVASGQGSAIFTATSGTVSSNQSAIVTATLNGQSQPYTVGLAAAAQLSSLSCASGTVSSPGTALCSVTLTAATLNTITIAMQSNNISVTVSSGVNIGAGLASTTFNASVASVPSNQTALLTATLNGISKTFIISATATVPPQLTTLSCTPSTLASHVSTACTITLNKPATSTATVLLASNSASISLPASATIAFGQSSATFAAVSGAVSGNQNVTVTATLNGQSQRATISLAVVANCEEFQTSSGGLCMIQDLLPWVTFGGGWQSRLNAGNLSKGNGGGPIQFGFTLLPAIPLTGGISNHLPAYFQDNKTKSMQVADGATYALSAGKSVAVTFLYPPADCDIHGQNCGGSADPNTNAYGSILVQYLASDPVFLRGLAKAQLTLLASGSQATETEMSAASLWTGPVGVSANQTANSRTNQQASAALANPGLEAITVRGTLFDRNGKTVTFRDFQVPSLGLMAFVFSLDPSQSFGGFGNAMFPSGQDFEGLVTFQAISPSGGSVTAVVLQYTGTGMSSVQLTSQTTPPILPSNLITLTPCAEFQAMPDGSCTAQYKLPWVVFGAGWETRLHADNLPAATANAVQFRFTLLPASSTTGGTQNHLPAYFTDSRSSQLQAGESASYALNAGESMDVDVLNPPAGCDLHGKNCAGHSDPSAFSFGSVLVEYSSSDPAALRAMPYPQLAFLWSPGDESYSSQTTEQGAVAATAWTAPVAVSAIQNANPTTNEEASAAIANPGSAAVIVRGTLHDQDGTVITYNDFQIAAAGSIGIVFSRDPDEPFGGFGSAAFPQGQDFSGWVTFEVTSPDNGMVTVLVLQDIGNTRSSVNVQSLP